MNLVADGTTEERLPINIGVDVGQITDPTAICVSEVHQVDKGKVRFTGKPTLGHHDARGQWVAPTGMKPVLKSEYIVRYIKRLPLGTSYPDVAKYISSMLDNPLFVNRKIRLLIDVTGVGRPVYDDLKYEISLNRHTNHKLQITPGGPIWVSTDRKQIIQIKPITFLYGETYNRNKGILGKKFLVSRTQSLLQNRRIHGPDTPEMKATTDELLVYEIKVSDEGTATFGAKTGKHDDLATSLALSCLEDPYAESVELSERMY